MKNKNLFKGILLSASLGLTAVLGLTGCDDDDDLDNPAVEYTISGDASGAQEVPAVSGDGTGTITGTYNKNTNTLTYDIGWSSLSGKAVAAHFHGPASTGVSAGVLVPVTITDSAATGKAQGTVVIVDSVETALLNGNVYYNVHTALNPTGEVRGQVMVKPK